MYLAVLRSSLTSLELQNNLIRDEGVDMILVTTPIKQATAKKIRLIEFW